MAYTIDVYDGTSWHPVLIQRAADTYPVESATLSEAVNAAFTLTFKVYDGHPSLSYLLAAIGSPLPASSQPTIRAKRDDAVIFEGRIYQHVLDDLTGAHEFTCEGMLARLSDYTVRPYSYAGTVSGYLDYLLSNCEGALSVGNVTVTDPNNYIVRSSEKPVMLWDEIADKCIGSPLGGYLEMRNGYIVDWLAQPSATTTQDMEAGINLTGLNVSVQPRTMYSGVLAYGAETGTTNSAGIPLFYNLSWASAYDVPVPSGYTLANMTLFKDALVNQIGERVCIVQYESITQVSNLMNRAVAFLNAQSTTPIIQVGAVDLADAGYNADAIECGATVQITGATFDDSMMCTAISRDLLDPASTTFEFGAPDNISSSGSGAGGSGANSGTSSPNFWHTEVAATQTSQLHYQTGFSSQPLEDVLTNVENLTMVDGGYVTLVHTPPYNNFRWDSTNLHARVNSALIRAIFYDTSYDSGHQTSQVSLQGTTASIGAYKASVTCNGVSHTVTISGDDGISLTGDTSVTGDLSVTGSITSPLSTAITNISDVLTQTSTQATNWPITAVRYQTWGKVAALSIQVTPTAAKSENYTNSAGTLVSGKRPAVQAGGDGTYTRGGITTTGSIALCAAQAMAANTSYTISFTYLLA